MSLQYTQHEVESELKDILKRGDSRQVSLITGIRETYLNDQFNPDNERKSPAFLFLQIQCALDEIDPERGEQFWEAIAQFRETSKKRKPVPPLDVRTETVAFNKESRDVIDIEISDGSPEEKLREITEAKRQLLKLEEAVLQELEQSRGKSIAKLRVV